MLSGVSTARSAALASQAWDVVSKTCVNTGDGGLSSVSLHVSFVIARRSFCTASKFSAPRREPVAVAAT